MRSRASSVVVPARRMKLQSELWASSSSRPAWVSQSRCSLLPTPRFTRRTIAREARCHSATTQELLSLSQ